MSERGPNPATGLGGNRPPLADLIEIIADRIGEHLGELQARHPDRWREIADLELDAMMLPLEVTSDDHVTEITAHVLKAKGVNRGLDEAREIEKAPFLKACRTIDGRFNPEIKRIEAAWKSIEARNRPYLVAKAAAAEAQRRETARLAQVAAQEAAARETAERLETARLAQVAADAAAKVRSATTDAGRQAAAEEYREAEQGRTLAHEAAEQAAQDTAGASRYAEAQERTADRGGLALTRSEAGSANVVKRDEIAINFQILRASLAPLGSYFPDDHIRSAVEKAHKLGVKDIPGVTVTKADHVHTSAKRK